MAVAHTEATISSSTDSASIAGLRAQLSGLVFLPGEQEYDAARRIWNAMIDKRPALIVRPNRVADIQRAIGYACDNQLPVSIKGGGHNVAGHAVTEGGLMLDLSSLRAVSVEPMSRTARVQGGALWSDVDRETAAFGLATTGGQISHTGVGGLTLGGGIGWLVGKHGMTIDNLRSVDLVTASGEFVTASAESHSDLFWAVRGGGGNFGVATSFEFALHPRGDVLAGVVAHPIAKARDMLGFYREFTASCPDELTIYAQLTTDPKSGARLAAMAAFWPGNPAEGERILAPLREFGSPMVDTIRTLPYLEWQQMFDAKYPHGCRYYWKSILTRELADGILDTMVEYGASPPLPTLYVTTECYAGPMNRIGANETAFAHREARYQPVVVGTWDDPANDEIGIEWVRGLHAAIENHALEGAFLNFNAFDRIGRAERVRAGYGVNWARLVEIKRRYDPTNIFRENSNITP